MNVHFIPSKGNSGLPMDIAMLRHTVAFGRSLWNTEAQALQTFSFTSPSLQCRPICCLFPPISGKYAVSLSTADS